MLVERARDGDQRAWDQIVERYAPLAWSICLDRLRRSPHLTTFRGRETRDDEAGDARISDATGGQRA